MFDWSKTVLNKNVNEKCKILTGILLTVFKNSIPHNTQNLTIKLPTGYIDLLHYP